MPGNATRYLRDQDDDGKSGYRPACRKIPDAPVPPSYASSLAAYLRERRPTEPVRPPSRLARLLSRLSYALWYRLPGKLSVIAAAILSALLCVACAESDGFSHQTNLLP